MRKTVFAVLLLLFVPDAARGGYSNMYGGGKPPPDETHTYSYETTSGEVLCWVGDGGMSCDDTASDCDDEPAPAPDPATGERSEEEQDD